MSNSETHFKQKFVDNAVAHMNDDHRDAMVDILHGFCQANWVKDAEMLSFDKEKMTLRGFGLDDQTNDFDVIYDQPLDKPAAFRPALIEMLKRARTLIK
ncbi:MAG: DUF2470 domain-containing protein [Bacteroidota bacterium]